MLLVRSILIPDSSAVHLCIVIFRMLLYLYVDILSIFTSMHIINIKNVHYVRVCVGVLIIQLYMFLCFYFNSTFIFAVLDATLQRTLHPREDVWSKSLCEWSTATS